MSSQSPDTKNDNFEDTVHKTLKNPSEVEVPPIQRAGRHSGC